MPLAPGQVLENRYRIVKLLGQGGFGAVYRAWDTKLNGPCAVKENLETTPAMQSQFAREASLLFNLKHAGLPKVFDSFNIAGQGQYLVMEYIEGEDLESMLEQAGKPLSETQVLPWILQVCDALSYLHNQQPPIIHRDIKPANIRITPQGQAILVDFGIAKIYDPQIKTTVGARAYTPGYSPPEQYGRGITDAQSDIYSLGATLYTLLTGQVPPDSVDIISQAVLAPPPVHVTNLSVSPVVGETIQKAMKAERTARFKNVEEFRQALTLTPQLFRFQGEGQPTTVLDRMAPVPPAPPTQVPPATAPRRLPWGWIGWVGILAAIVVMFLMVVIGREFSKRFSLLEARAITENSITTPLQQVETTPTGILVTPIQPTATTLANNRVMPITPSKTPTIIINPTKSTVTQSVVDQPILLVDWSKHETSCPGEDGKCWIITSSVPMASSSKTFIDPKWKNPYLVFEHKCTNFNYPLSGNLDVTIYAMDKENVGLMLRDKRCHTWWETSSIDLAPYQNYQILIKFMKYAINKWMLRNIRIEPLYNSS